MKESIYTIPINAAFGRFDGCPMCRLYNELEPASLDYIMGAAMMEPDVRIKTNEQGFCLRHYSKMLAEKNKLSLALMLESRLPELSASLFGRAEKAAGREQELKKLRGDAKASAGGCFVCARVAFFMEKYNENVIYLWRREPDFREKFLRQPFFCLPHYSDLLECSRAGLPRKTQAEFIRELTGICKAYLNAVCADVSAFCGSFDYRQAGKPLAEGAQTAVERAIAFLAGIKNG